MEKNYETIIKELGRIKSAGYITTHRTGQTGIGKTLEDLLGIEENNIPLSNTTFAELKAARKGSGSMLTLFTKSPLPEKANAELLNGFGYEAPRSKGRKVLHSTVTATGYNMLKGKPAFIIKVLKNKLVLVSHDGQELGFWDEQSLRNAFDKKLHHLLYVLADHRGKGKSEEFWFNEAWLLSGFSFDSFLNLVKEGVICVDNRIGQYPDGRPHDHGTGFRVMPDKLDDCFTKRERVL